MTPLGAGVDHVWSRLLRGDIGISALPAERFGTLPSRIAAVVPRGAEPGAFNTSTIVDKAAARTQGPDYIAFALGAAREALSQAGFIVGGTGKDADALKPGASFNKDRAGVAIGCGIGGIAETAETAEQLVDGSSEKLAAGGRPATDAGYRKVSPFFVPRILANMPAGHVSIRYGLRGPNHAAATACASGAHAVGDAFRFIKYGDADVMLAGGTEACVSPLAIAGFSRARALATAFNDDPARASRPFDAKRDGFVLGEGGAVLVLEAAEHALARGARILAEVRGYGACGDAHHITAPADDGSGAFRCMAAALAEGGLLPGHVDYVNAHATSTPIGDAIEAAGLARLFRGADGAAGSERGHKVAVSSTKGAIGHLLGAAGAVEAAFAALAVAHDAVPPTVNLESPDPSLPTDVCDFVTPTAPGTTSNRLHRPVRAALSNSFGFGGTNCSVLFSKWQA